MVQGQLGNDSGQGQLCNDSGQGQRYNDSGQGQFAIADVRAVQ